LRMEFVSANPSVVRSFKQRVLLNARLRVLRKPKPLLTISDFLPDGIGDELADMMGFNVEHQGEAAPLKEGSRLLSTPQRPNGSCKHSGLRRIRRVSSSTL
jgi:hypothetical protein